MSNKVPSFLLILLLWGLRAMSQVPEVTVRFANPHYDCDTETYCLDVEFQSDTPDTEIALMNVRFYYAADVLDFIAMGDFQGGYDAFSPNPPYIDTYGPSSGSFFSLEGPMTYVNGAINISNYSAPPIFVSTTGWTKLFNICFNVVDPAALEQDDFCPSVIWDLEKDPADGGFQAGPDGVEITITSNPRTNTDPTDEKVIQFNWDYNQAAGTPYGFPASIECTSTVCTTAIPDITILKTANPLTYSAAGDVINYTIVVMNTGEVLLSNILVNDPLTGLNTTLSSLAPGSARSYNQTYVITQADVDRGFVTNVATATGFDSSDNTVSDTAEATVTADLDASVRISKTADPDTFSQAGDVISYTIIVENTGGVTLNPVFVLDPLIQLGVSAGSMQPGDLQTYTGSYTITEDDVRAGQFLNTATVEGTAPGGITVSDEDEAVVVLEIEGETELVITKTADTNLVLPGEMVTFVIELTNAGTETAYEVTITDVLSSDFTYVGGSGGLAYDPDTRTLTWTVGNLGAGESITEELYVMVNEGLEPGTAITNQAFAQSLNSRPAASCLAQVLVIGESDLSIAKTANLSAVQAGQSFTYSLIVTNNGPTHARNVRVKDELPQEVVFISADQNGIYDDNTHSVEWSVGNMNPGETLVFRIEVSLDSQTPEGRSVINIATVISDINDLNPLNNTSMHVLLVIGPRADLEVSKLAVDETDMLTVRDRVQQGEHIVYAISITNYGPDDAHQIVVTDTLPTHVTFISADGNASYDAQSRSVTWHIDLLLNGETIILKLVTRIRSEIPAGTIIVNHTQAVAATIDPYTDNNTGSEEVEVMPAELFIPDVFSPNGDGINDKFVIRGLDRYPNNSIIIINRWGNKVFEAAPYGNDWDGSNQFGITVGGNQLPVGTYYYILDLGEEGGNKVMRGYIYLTR